jgi:pimeloyl-ACP methyl ester carboxylesterase
MHLNHRTTGSGPAVLLIHGAAEDVGMLGGAAEAIAARGFRVIWYDRRGTGGSTRDDWPGGGADQHADDAAALLRSLDALGATVVGFSSGGVVALALAARHPEVASRVIAWEPAAVGMLPGGAEMHAALVAPSDEHLAAHPGDWVGAFHVMLGVISGGQADLDDPEVKLMEVNAEAALRDDGPLITARGFRPGELPPGLVTVAVSGQADPLHAEIADRVADLIDDRPVVVEAADDHEIYLTAPEVVADFLADRCLSAGPR